MIFLMSINVLSHIFYFEYVTTIIQKYIALYDYKL